MSKNRKKQQQDQYYTIECVLCERKTLKPEKKKGKKQYLVKYENYEFEECHWVHATSIQPQVPYTPFWDWNQLNTKEKRRRYNFLNKPKPFMNLSNAEKIKKGWLYVAKFNCIISTNTPELTTPPPSPESPTHYTWIGGNRKKAKSNVQTKN